ncbi:MAG: hypothetical protein M3Y07_14450, partial [Acidobacteriota bacterium]|nr:hypothetical protein [Acidobacteriota bacterium]
MHKPCWTCRSPGSGSGDVESDRGRSIESPREHLEALRLRRDENQRQFSPLAASAYVASLNRVATLLIGSRNNRRQARRNFDEAIAVSVKLLARTPSDVHALAQVAIEYWGKAEIAGHNL